MVNVTVQETGVALVTLNRPSARNALSTELARELHQIFDRIAKGTFSSDSSPLFGSNNQVRAVVLTGAGSAFCAGADLKERQNMSDEEWEAQHKVFQKAALAFHSLPVPTIAAVNGPAFGGGLELICLADWSVASAGATFRFPEVHLGIFPGLGATVTLPRLISPIHARRLILSAEPISAEEGYRIGLFAKLVKDGPTAVKVALEDAARVAENGPHAVRRAKQSIRECSEMTFYDSWKHSLDLYGQCFRSEERVEGIRAYGEKRPPKYD